MKRIPSLDDLVGKTFVLADGVDTDDGDESIVLRLPMVYLEDQDGYFAFCKISYVGDDGRLYRGDFDRHLSDFLLLLSYGYEVLETDAEVAAKLEEQKGVASIMRATRPLAPAEGVEALN